MVKVSVPSSTTPAGLVMVALRVTFCAPPLKVAEALAAAVAVAAALMTSVWLGVGEAEEVGRAVVHRLDDVGAGPGAGRQDVDGGGGPGGDIHGDGRRR